MTLSQIHNYINTPSGTKHTCSIGHSQEHDKDETNQAVITMDTESVTMVTECVTMDTE